MMDCLYAKATPVITDCVMAELEKLGPRYRIALRIARDPRFERITCDHKGTYADDCIVNRVMQHKIYIVATNDVDLKRRLRKIPGVPIMSCGNGKYVAVRGREGGGCVLTCAIGTSLSGCRMRLRSRVPGGRKCGGWMWYIWERRFCFCGPAESEGRVLIKKWRFCCLGKRAQ